MTENSSQCMLVHLLFNDVGQQLGSYLTCKYQGGGDGGGSNGA